MAFNPYTEQSASGYNSTPPSDDGTASAANRVKYATVKDKLADPVKNLADAIDDATATAFGSLLLNGRTAKTTTYTVTTGDYGKVVACTGTFTVNLPAAATADSGFAVIVQNVSTGTITIDGDGSETINGSETFILGPQRTIVLQSDGSNWFGYLFGGGSVAVICDQKAQNTPGGGFTAGADRTRDLNTEVSDPDGIVSIATNQFTLANSGQYLIEWIAPANQVDGHQSFLYDITGAAELSRGSTAFSENTANTSQGGPSVGSYVHTITASNIYEIRHRCATTQATNGFGLAANIAAERYTFVTITKLT